jgi:hypothetical protein
MGSRSTHSAMPLSGRGLAVGSVGLALPCMARKTENQGIRCSSLLKLLLDAMT